MHTRLSRLFTRVALTASLTLPALAFAQPVENDPHALQPGAAGLEHEDPHGDKAATHGVGEHATAGAHGEHGGEHALAPINWFDFSNHEQLPYAAGLLNFVLLLAIYVKFGKKPISDALQKRRSDIATDIEEAARVKREAEERAKKYQADLANLDQDLEVARQALVEAGKKERERIVAEAKDRAVRMKREAEVLLGQEAKQKNQDLTIETIERATGTAEQLLQTKLTQEDHLRLAEEFLVELSRKPVDAASGGSTAPGGSSAPTGSTPPVGSMPSRPAPAPSAYGGAS